MISSRCQTSDVGTLLISFLFSRKLIKPQQVEEKLSANAGTVSHETSGWLSNQASKLNLVPRALFFLPDRPTHQQEREGDGKGNILWGWPNHIYTRYWSSIAWWTTRAIKMNAVFCALFVNQLCCSISLLSNKEYLSIKKLNFVFWSGWY